ncbi:type IX secretion system protein PorG [Mucilaginibacter sp.]
MFKFAAVILLIFISFNLQAQTWEVGLAGGGAAYMGDLNPNNPLKFSGGAGSVFLKRNFNAYLSARLTYTYGSISAADSNSTNQQFRDRNLSFTDHLSELSVIGEFNFMNYIPDVSHNRYTPFFYLGIASVHYNPTTIYNGKKYDLRPLETEGQANPYPGSAIAFPYGVGIKYNITGKWNLIADIGYRQPNTDYLDDVAGTYPNPGKLSGATARALSDRSGEKTGIYIGTPGTQRGDMRSRDTYMFAQFTISYTFVTQKCYFEE